MAKDQNDNPIRVGARVVHGSRYSSSVLLRFGHVIEIREKAHSWSPDRKEEFLKISWCDENGQSYPVTDPRAECSACNVVPSNTLVVL